MSSREYKQVCALLVKLDKGELAEVSRRLKFLGGSDEADNEPVATTHPSKGYDWLLFGIEDELSRRGVLAPGKHLPVTRIVSGWGQTSAEVRAGLAGQLESEGKARRHPWSALGRLCARTLAIYLEKGGVPVRPKTMLQNADKVLLALDAQFPGYMAAGMLHCCLNQQLIGVD